ncbi:MAG: hypothetical protein EP343_14790 [Deltaproteobacteria bacterium]|nr:MAG: hypothetical protein EP343_14790 [Deltaproteobacteria bacterium]
MWQGLRILSLVLVLFAGGAVGSSVAEAQSNRALNYVERNLIHIRLHFSGASLSQGGVQYPINMFGSGLDGLFDGSSEALELASTYRSLRVSGFVLWVLGLATLGAELVMLTFEQGRNVLINPSTGISPVFWGMTIGGGVIGVVGGLLINFSNVFLSRAVAAFNRDLFSRVRSRRWRMSFNILPEGGAMVGVRCRF